MTGKDMQTLRQQRKDAFAKFYDINEDKRFLDMLNENQDRRNLDFLRNPVMYNIYSYLVNYLFDFYSLWTRDDQSQDCKSVPRVLDWGCGHGQVSYLLKKCGFDVVSCDISSTAQFTKTDPIILAKNISITELTDDSKLPFQNGEFDIVVSFGVIEHVKDDLASLKEIKRILKPGGLFFCVHLPSKLSWTQRISRFRGNCCHDRLYLKNEVKNLLKETNLNLIDMWHRSLLPKNTLIPPAFHLAEKADLWLCRNTPLKFFATNIEFIAEKPCN